jgi:hypothetical protein
VTETDFFRIARERMGDYTLTINRESTLGVKSYKVRLDWQGGTLSGEDDTLPAALSSLMARAGIDRRRASRPDGTPAPSPGDSHWPGA